MRGSGFPELGLFVVVPEVVYPQAHAQWQVLALRKQHKNTVGRRGIVLQHRHQLAGGDFASTSQVLRQAMPWPARHQSYNTWPSEQSSGPPGLRCTTRRRRPRWACERPSARLRRLARQRQAVMLGQLGGMLGRATALQVAGRRYAQAPVVGNAHTHQRRVRQVPTRTAQSKPSPARSTTRSLRFSEMVTSGAAPEKRGTRARHGGGQTGRRGHAQMPAGLDATGRHAGLGIGHIGQQALAVFQKALPSCVRLMRRVVRTSNFTPRCSSRASSLRPMMAGATPSAARQPSGCRALPPIQRTRRP